MPGGPPPGPPTAPSFLSTSRTEISGTPSRSWRASRFSPARWARCLSVPIRCRRRSPRCMTRLAAPARRIGRRSWLLYEVLERISPGPVVTLNRAVAIAMVNGPRAGLALLGTLDGDDRMAHNHRLEAVRAHLLERAGELGAARDSYRKAARMTASIPEQRYLAMKAAGLG